VVATSTYDAAWRLSREEHDLAVRMGCRCIRQQLPQPSLMAPVSPWTPPSSSILLPTGDSPMTQTDSGQLAAASGSTIPGGSAIAAFAPVAGLDASPTAVPEPSATLLAALGAIGFAVAARRSAIHQ